MTSRGPFQPCEATLVVSRFCEKGKALQGNIFLAGMEISMLRVLVGTCLSAGNTQPLSTAGQAPPGSFNILKKSPRELEAFRVQQELGKSRQYHHLYSDFWVHLNPTHIPFSRSDLDPQKPEHPLTGALSPRWAQTCKRVVLLHVPRVHQLQEETKS